MLWSSRGKSTDSDDNLGSNKYKFNIPFGDIPSIALMQCSINIGTFLFAGMTE